MQSILRDNPKFEVVILDKNASFHDLSWVEDTELGRGYLLISDSSNSGKVWRYETGGGLIPIGKSLYLDHSGCRSNLWIPCHDTCSNSGSKGIAIQVVKDEPRFDIGQLIVVESGEQRIVRLEKDGARTPLVLNVPSLCQGHIVDVSDGTPSSLSHRRLNRPGKVMYTPFGDLMFIDEEECMIPNKKSESESESTKFTSSKSGIFRVKEIVNIPPISFRQSRDAHAWTVEDMVSKHTQVKVELAYVHNNGYIYDMIVGKDVSSIYVAALVRDDDCRHVIYKIIENEEDDDDDETVKELGAMDIFFDLTKFFPPQDDRCKTSSTALAIDHQGNLFATLPSGLVVLHPDGNLLASIDVHPMESEPTSLVIGNDGYLYMTTQTTVQRMKVKSKLLEYPTNLIVPKLQ